MISEKQFAHPNFSDFDWFPKFAKVYVSQKLGGSQ